MRRWIGGVVCAVMLATVGGFAHSLTQFNSLAATNRSSYTDGAVQMLVIALKREGKTTESACVDEWWYGTTTRGGQSQKNRGMSEVALEASNMTTVKPDLKIESIIYVLANDA